MDLSGSKELLGDSLSEYTGDDGFAFTLYSAVADADGKVQKGTLIHTAHLNAEGKFVFGHNTIDDLIFDQTGTYHFIVEEAVVGNDPLMIFDDTYYEVTVEITDNMAGELLAETTVTMVKDGQRRTVAVNGLNFSNKRDPAPITANISGKKKYNITLPNGLFTFDLYKATPSETGLALSGDPIDIKSTTNGVFRFDDITFTKLDDVGFYFYAIKEVIPSAVDKDYTLEGIRYDPTVYYVLVSVRDNGDGTLSVFSENITADGVRDKIVFSNKTVQMSDTPATGDSANLALWCFLLLISGMALITLPLYVKRKRA